MVEYQNKTVKWLTNTEEELIEKMVDKNHAFRRLNALIDFEALISPYRELYSSIGAEGVDVIKGFKALLIQFWENYSDREMEKALEENVAIKWFCGFGLTEATPDHSYFGKLRKRLGAKSMADIFNEVNVLLRSKGLFGDAFKFIDASTLITKTALWEERDRAIRDGEKSLNNSIVGNYAADKDARWGAKSKNHIWFGHKRHCTVDMRHGLIEKLAVTPANVPDQRMLKNICPKNCMVFMDKIYDTKNSNLILQINNCASGIIRKNNNKTKNNDLDKWRSKTRMPFESTFSKLSKRARYRGSVKVLLQCFAEAIAYNLKKSIRVLPNPIGA
jgi:IS5 family transposase